MRRDDPDFVPPSMNANRPMYNGASGSGAEKRGREDDEGTARQAKREKAGDDDGEEMDMEEDDDTTDKKQGS